MFGLGGDSLITAALANSRSNSSKHVPSIDPVLIMLGGRIVMHGGHATLSTESVETKTFSVLSSLLK